MKTLVSVLTAVALLLTPACTSKTETATAPAPAPAVAAPVVTPAEPVVSAVSGLVPEATAVVVVEPATPAPAPAPVVAPAASEQAQFTGEPAKVKAPELKSAK